MDLIKNNNTGTQEKNIMRTYLDGIKYRVARTRSELEESYALVYREYLKRGYVSGSKTKQHLTIHNILPNTTTFIAETDDEILATATVIPDSKLGLPMDDLYKKELDALRHGNKLCEISMLASDTSLFQQGTSMLLNAKKMFLIYYLFKHILDFVRIKQDLDYICIAINPKHKMTYENLFFEDLGPLKSYDKVNGAPALGKCLNLKTAPQKCEKLNKSNIYKMFFSGEVDDEALLGKKSLDLEDIQYFFMKKNNILQNISAEEMSFIEQCYPSYDFSKIMPNIKQLHSINKLKRL